MSVSRSKQGVAHALLGENGAGKSTIVKLLSGLIEPDRGTISLFGEEVRLHSPRTAHRHGVQTAFQEMTLTPDLTVLDNMLLPYGPQGWTGMIRRRAAELAVREHFDSLGLDIELWREVGELDLAIQQKIEIARAVFRKPRILLLDEPTSTLAGRDVDWLGEVIAAPETTGRHDSFHLASHPRSAGVLRPADDLAQRPAYRHGGVERTHRCADHRNDHRPLHRSDLSSSPAARPG